MRSVANPRGFAAHRLQVKDHESRITCRATFVTRYLSLITALLRADSRPGIGETFSGFGDELPIVGGRVQRELEDAVGVGVADFAVGDRDNKRAMTFSAGANDEFANPVFGAKRS